MRGFLNDKLPGGLFKRDFFISLALFLLAIVTRVPFTEHFFGHPDGPEYAIAIERFLPREGFPYPLTFTYVMLIRLINFIVNNAHTSILTQSVIGTGLLVIIVYWLGLTIFDRTKGIWAALIVLSAPWFWYYGITYFPFMFTGFFSGASALGFYYAVFKKNKYGLYWGTVSFAMLCGYRHPEFMFTAPLYLWALLNTRPKDALRSLLLFTLVCLLWFIPEVIMYGGFREFIGIFQNFSKS